MNWKQATFLVLASLTFLYLFIGIIVYLSDQTSTKKIVDCYDKYNNKIIGVSCEEIKLVNEEKGLKYMLILSGIVFLLSILLSCGLLKWLE